MQRYTHEERNAVDIILGGRHTLNFSNTQLFKTEIEEKQRPYTAVDVDAGEWERQHHIEEGRTKNTDAVRFATLLDNTAHRRTSCTTETWLNSEAKAQWMEIFSCFPQPICFAALAWQRDCAPFEVRMLRKIGARAWRHFRTCESCPKTVVNF